MNAEERLQELKLELPPAPKPAGVYKPVIAVGNVAYVSGHGPLRSDGTLIMGRIGAGLDQQAGYDAARQTGLAILASLRRSRQPRSREARDQGARHGAMHARVHAASGRHQWLQRAIRESVRRRCGCRHRSTVGMTSLPMGMAVEIEAIFEIEQLP